MSRSIVSSYPKKGVWLKANLHAHSKVSDGTRQPQEVIDAYAALGYDVLMISDHNKICSYDGLDPKGLVLIPGYENGNELPHIQHINAKTVCEVHDDRQETIDFIRADGGLPILNHPNWWREFDHIPIKKMLEWQGYHGMEIANSLAKWQLGNHLALDKWDQLLSLGRRVVGFGNDDSHSPRRDGETFNMLLAREKSFEGALEAITQGSLYVSTGVLIQKIEVGEKTVKIKTKNADRIAVVTRYGKRFRQEDKKEYLFEIPDDLHGYFRFECYGRGEAMAWTQPFWIEESPLGR